MVTATASALTPSDSGPALTVTAQQSRFHVDLEQDNATGREVVVKDLSISLGERELLSHTNLSLQPGRHYVLVGRNGVGKSTLLRAIASGTVPGIPTTLMAMVTTEVAAVVSGSHSSSGDRLQKTTWWASC